jgi:chromosome partitioning protein
MLQNAILKSTAISDAGVTKQTLYEVDRAQFIRGTYDRALESNLVNSEVEAHTRSTWGRR